MQGTKLSYQERECKLYNEFDMFTSIKGESLHEYYLRFAQLINDMDTIGMTMQQVQVNIKFINALQPELSKFRKYVRECYFIIQQHKIQENDLQLNSVQYPQQLSSIPQTTYSSQPYLPTYEAPHHPQQYQNAYQPQISHPTPSVPQNAYHSPLISPQPQAEFSQLDSGIVVPIFLLVDDLIPCLNKATTFMPTIVASLQGRQSQSFASTGTKGNATSLGGNNAAGQTRVVKCYNSQGEGHMARQCTQPTILHGLRKRYAYDSDCDDTSSAKAVLMANISSNDSDVLSEETKTVNESLTAELERYKERVKTFEQRLNINLRSHEKMIDSQMDGMIQNRNALKQEIDSLKQTLSKQVKEKGIVIANIYCFQK
ncbi:integrase, catalytic region, zinc finger, CCHC-type containing protein [Tanacetum coccineum]